MHKAVAGVLAQFDHVDGACDAIRDLKTAGHHDLTVYSAAPNHELEDAIGRPVSPVRLFTLIGGLIGCAAGFGMTIWMSLDWPLLVGGKPIAPIPPYVVLGFELTILIGALSTVAGLVLLAVLQAPRGQPFDPRFSDDRIGIFVPCDPHGASAVEAMCRRCGSVEVTRDA